MTQASQSAGASPEATDGHQYLTFAVGQEKFGFDILGIKEIIEYAAITDIPMMPDYVRGVINLRGAVVPVVDLGHRFGKGASPVTKRTCIVIIQGALNADSRDLGVMVDSVDSVVDIPVKDIEPPPDCGRPLRQGFIQGMGKLNGKFIILLGKEGMLESGDTPDLLVTS